MAGEDLDVSFVCVDAAARELEALRATAIAIQRQDTRASPVANFGRMPPGYVSSSSYSCELIHSGGLFRGGRVAKATAKEMTSVAPIAPLSVDPQAHDWCGFDWHEGLVGDQTGASLVAVSDVRGRVLTVAPGGADWVDGS